MDTWIAMLTWHFDAETLCSVIAAYGFGIGQHGIERGVDLGKFFGFQRAGGGCIGRR